MRATTVKQESRLISPGTASDYFPPIVTVESLVLIMVNSYAMEWNMLPLAQAMSRVEVNSAELGQQDIKGRSFILCRPGLDRSEEQIIGLFGSMSEIMRAFLS